MANSTRNRYRKRVADDILVKKMNAFGAVLITGPKGCGKTTTAKRHCKSIIEFQDEDNRDGYLREDGVYVIPVGCLRP